MDWQRILTIVKDTELKIWQVLVLAHVLLIILYFVVSPYQNCKRDMSSKGWCFKSTNW